ncbi:MAG: YibE/F family protein [Bacilli bacterium]|nr:YibE/F family protein [Bacilli bacterium]
MKYIKNYFKNKIQEIKSLDKKQLIIRICTIVSTIIIASLILLMLYKNTYYKNDNYIYHVELNFRDTKKAKVLEIIDKEEPSEDERVSYTLHITYKCEILEGNHKGEEHIVHQYLNDYTSLYTNTVDKGVIIYVAEQQRSDNEVSYIFNGDSISFDHYSGILVLAIILVVLLLIISKSQGLLTIISLTFSILSILYVFLPRIIAGESIYLLTAFVCVFTVVVTYLIVVGINKKGICATLGCLAGLLLSGLLSIIAMNLLHVTGHYSSEEINDISMLLQSLYNVDIKINLKALIFASTLIGALGAVMDVSLSLASSLKEVYDNAKEVSIINTIKSGFVIGKDMIGTMVNTLILAYVASDLSFILFIMVNHSNEFIFRSEYIAVAIAQALVGSIAMVLTIPLTSLICALIYNKKNNKEINIIGEGEQNEEN